MLKIKIIKQLTIKKISSIKTSVVINKKQIIKITKRKSTH